MNDNKSLHEKELKKVNGGKYYGSYRFEEDQLVRVIEENVIGKINKHDGLADREAYIVFFDGNNKYEKFGNYHYYAEELEAV